MKLTALILFVLGLHVSAKTTSQSITLSGKNLTLETVFAAVKTQTGYIALFDGDDIKDAKPVTVHAVNQSLERFLMEVFKDQPLHYLINNTSIFVNRKKNGFTDITTLPPQLQEDSVPAIKISGTVMGFNGQVLAGATIRVKGKKGATTSNSQGRFEIAVEAGGTLMITYAGYVTKEERIYSSQHVVVHLEPNALLEEAVVYNGYQKIQQKFLTGSVTSLKMDSILQPGLSTVDKMLEGRVPGLTFMQNSGQAGAAPKLRIRGTNTYLGSREPLWVVDGVIRTNPFPIDPQRINDPDFVNLLGNAISGLNPFDIEQIDVLKDATAAALYGVRAANGVIVITTKRGKPGPPLVSYSLTNTFTTRPRYSDRSIHMMNSDARVDVSREMIEKQFNLRGAGHEIYEYAMQQYYDGAIDYNTLRETIRKAESMNTDWLGNVMQDVLATNHTLSVSGGNNVVNFRTSLGYRSEPGVIKKEKTELITGMLNMQMKYRKVLMDLNVQINSNTRNYTPAEIGVLNYAYGTNRSIPLYNDDGSLYYYSPINSDPSSLLFHPLNKMNIINEMNNTGDKMKANEYNASLHLTYEIVKNLQFNTRISYTYGNSFRETWFSENTEWANQLRLSAYRESDKTYAASNDPMPFGGEFRHLMSTKSNYQLNARLSYASYLDKQNRHQLSADLAMDISSYKNYSLSSIARGYYPERGKSFSNIQLSQYLTYARWVSSNSIPKVTEELNNGFRPFLTTTYIFNNKYVLSGTLSQEFSNSFGSRSNERFLPTWALSGRWNLHDDILSNSAWIDNASLLLSLGKRGNMLPGQTVNTIMNKGARNIYFNEFSSTVAYFPNPYLKWEMVQDYNANLIFSLFKGKVSGSVGYFFNKTTNAFMEMKVSAVNGAINNTYVVNGGTLENQGLELGLNFKLIDRVGVGDNKRFMWRLDPQLGQVFNRLLSNSVNSRNVLIDEATLNYNSYLNGTVPVNGKSVNTFYSYQFKGLDPQFGYPVFHHAEPENRLALASKYNNMSKGEVFQMVMVESGRREPVVQGSINNAITYGDWIVNINMSYSIGNKVRLMKIASGNYGTYRPSSQQNLRMEFVDRWRYPGDEHYTNIPAIQGAGRVDPLYYSWWMISNSWVTNTFAENYYQMYDNADVRVVSGDFVKLQNVSVAYRLPQSITDKWRCNGAMISLNGNNLFVIADKALKGQDPTQSGTSPNINLSIRPVYTLNFNLSF